MPPVTPAETAAIIAVVIGSMVPPNEVLKSYKDIREVKHLYDFNSL